MFIRKVKFLLSLLLCATSIYNVSAQQSYENLIVNELKIVIPSEEEKAYINKNPVLTVACDPNWQPFEYINNTLDVPQYSGINYIILKKIASKAGIELKFITTESYSESLNCFVSGNADILSGYSKLYLNNMSYKADFTNPIYSMPYVLVSREKKIPQDGDSIAYLLDIFDYKQSIEQKYEGKHLYFKKKSSLNELVDSLIKKECDFAFINKFDLESHNIPKYYTIIELGITYDFSFALSNSLPKEVLSLFNKAINSFSSEEFDSIIFTSLVERRYFEHENNMVKREKSFFIIVSICIAVFLTLFILLFIYISNKRRPRLLDFDETTGIPSFTKFKHEVREKLKTALPNEYFLLSLDVDNFSFINDSYGFNIGNALLIEISQQFLFECKKNDFLLCRFYADNFVIFGKNPGFIGIIEEYVYRLTHNTDYIKIFLPENYELTFSSGVYYVTDNTIDVSVMIDNANTARRLGKNASLTHRITEFTKQMSDESEMKKTITLSMNKAIENNEFEVYFQPKFRFSDSIVMGAEALIRWNNPEKGFLSPGSFIPLFEHNGFIQKIDLYVFEKVCAFLDSWNHSGPDGKCPQPITISFNLSRFHLYNPNLIKDLTSIKRNYHIEPCQIEVELTESIMFDNKRRLIHTMQQIRDSGYTISVDDFGSGYSSLNLLKDMPANVLKLDKEFLSVDENNEKEKIIIQSVVNMAKQLNITTVAEGVETNKQSDFLKNIGCDIVQGFLYSKPIQEKQYRKLLENTFLN